MNDETKATFLLLTFPKSFDNVIDNLQTKENLTYDDVCNRLLDINLRKDNTESNAFCTKHNRRNTLGNKKECSWCKSKGSNHIGHTWQECFKLKKHKESRNSGRKERDAANKAQDMVEDGPNHTAFTAILDTWKARKANLNRNSNNKTWIFDTGATRHMSSNEYLFSNLMPYSGNVRIGDDSILPVKGKGNVTTGVLLPDNKTLEVTIHDVLYVPDLGPCNLLSWSQLQDRGIHLTSSNYDMYLHDKSGTRVGWIKRVGNEYFLQQPETSYTAEYANIAYRRY